MIAIVNYGLGNVHAFANIYKRLNIPAEIASTPQDLRQAEKIILPGVGAFDWAMTRLNESGLRDTLEVMVVGDSMHVLGICVGMQMMANRNDEGQLDGLGWIDGEVKRFDESSFTQKTHREYLFAWPVSRRSKPGTHAGDEVRSPGRWPWLAGLARTSAVVSATLYAPTGEEVFQGSIRTGKHCNAASLAGSTRASFLHNGDKFDLSACFEINNING